MHTMRSSIAKSQSRSSLRRTRASGTDCAKRNCSRASGTPASRRSTGASRLDGEIGVAMEFVGGEDLETLVERGGPLRVHDVIEIGLHLARALETVHRAGVLHRAVRPSNVKRTDEGRTVLLNFGGSRNLFLRTKGPTAGDGTPLYLAPEVLAGGPASVQSDLYSLGVLLYFLATARHPLRETGGAGLPRPLAPVLDALLSNNPADRPRSAASVAARLSRRPPRAALAATIAVVAIALAGAFSARFMARTSGFRTDPATPARRIEFAIAPWTIGRPSLDGRILPFVDRRNGGLAVMHVDSGGARTPHQRSRHSHPARRRLGGVRGRIRVAYEWLGDAMEDQELRVIDLATRHVTALWHTPRYDTEVIPTAWSRDGTQIAGVIRRPDDTSDLFVIGIGDAAPRIVHAASAAWPSFSDDDRFLVFQRKDPESSVTALALLDLTDGTVRPLHIRGSNEQTPFWTKGALTFVSQRDGNTAVWTLRMDANGAPNGVPIEVPGSQGVVDLLGVAQDGAVLCEQVEGTAQVIVSNLDGSRPQQVSSGPGSHFSPDWSADGRRIAYLTEPLTASRHILTVRDLVNGTDQSFESLASSFGTPGRIGYNPRLSPDGTRVLLRGPKGFFLYDFETHQESRGYFAGRSYGDIEWDDDSHVFVLEFDRGISLLDLITGDEQRIYAVPAGSFMGRGIAVSPGRARIAFVTTAGPGLGATSLWVANRDGSGARALLTRPRSRSVAAIPTFAAVPLLLGQWSADGRHILFAATDVLPSGFVKWETDLWAVPADGGAPYRTGLSSPGLRDIRSAADGKRIAYTLFTIHTRVVLVQEPMDASLEVR